jgi:predicted methyltransferase
MKDQIKSFEDISEVVNFPYVAIIPKLNEYLEQEREKEREQEHEIVREQEREQNFKMVKRHLVSKLKMVNICNI